jgi:hypothetical protein
VDHEQLRLTTDSLRADLDTSPLRARLRSLQFNGADGFYLLFDLPTRPNRGKNGARLEDEARRFRDGTVKRLRQSLGRTAVDLMSVHASRIKVPDDPRVRPSRHILRGDEIRSLLALGVNYGQGYLLGRPSPRISH